MAAQAYPIDPFLRPEACSTIAKPAASSNEKKDAAANMNMRHRLFLRKRVAPAGQSEAWRPQKRYRLAAAKWVQGIDTQLRFGTAWGGLHHVQYQPGAASCAPENWRHWS